MRDHLIEDFTRRGLTPGDRLPTEAEIAEQFGVGRSTAREALKLLEQEGLVVAEQGRGRFLSTLSVLKVERPITRFESVTAMLAALGYHARTLVLSVEEGPPTPEERQALRLRGRAQVVRLERLRSDGENPLVYTVEAVPREVLPGPLRHVDWTGSLTDLLGAHGHLPVSSTARLQAVDLPEVAATRYHLDSLGPWLLVTETAVTASGRPVLHASDYHRGDAFAFHVVRR
ncbi:GntR family transcriptional regulator [Planosporangium thailandense]|uniref:GntR family transcriptional regulator n=1 Tax=Planosporangium thailandense TaxID=765197 RepID=A0ABX0XXF0_9ACTN|nr:GntR family transcriptional regulator [Planosporangium thailandense]